MATAYLALGSNLGDRRANLEAALAALRANTAVRVLAVSGFIETEPVGGPPGQGAYLNGAAAVETDLEPHALLTECKRIEKSLGRREGPRWGPRIVDLDILFYGAIVLDAPDLTLPHPRLRERRFVLEPLAEIAPDLVDPVTGLTVGELLARLAQGL